MVRGYRVDTTPANAARIEKKRKCLYLVEYTIQQHTSKAARLRVSVDVVRVRARPRYFLSTQCVTRENAGPRKSSSKSGDTE